MWPAAHLYLVPKLIMSRTILPRPNMPYIFTYTGTNIVLLSLLLLKTTLSISICRSLTSTFSFQLLFALPSTNFPHSPRYLSASAYVYTCTSVACLVKRIHVVAKSAYLVMRAHLFACPFFRTYLCSSHLTNLCEIWCWLFLWKSVWELQIGFKSGRNIGDFAWRLGVFSLPRLY
jgi:hypothetical protein